MLKLGDHHCERPDADMRPDLHKEKKRLLRRKSVLEIPRPNGLENLLSMPRQGPINGRDDGLGPHPELVAELRNGDHFGLVNVSTCPADLREHLMEHPALELLGFLLP